MHEYGLREFTRQYSLQLLMFLDDFRGSEDVRGLVICLAFGDRGHTNVVL